ncbi:response regulator, partial [Candidatus Omnitrophota bacterium]
MSDKILIVDDEDIVCEGLSKLLEKEGLYSQRACSANEGLSKLAEEAFDIVIIDYILPDMTGMDLS